MPPARKPRAKARRTTTAKPPIPSTPDIWARTRLLVEVLLQVMEEEIREPTAERSEQWLKLFGAKDSAVVNLQKLVQLLAELHGQAPSDTAPTEPVSQEELAILQAWLGTANAASASAEAEA